MKKDTCWENHILIFLDDLHSENHRKQNLACSVPYITPVKLSWFKSVRLQKSDQSQWLYEVMSDSVFSSRLSCMKKWWGISRVHDERSKIMLLCKQYRSQIFVSIIHTVFNWSVDMPCLQFYKLSVSLCNSRNENIKSPSNPALVILPTTVPLCSRYINV